MRRLWVLLLAGVLAICGLAVGSGVDNIRTARAQLEMVRQTNLTLDRENRAMYRTVQNLKQDNVAIERLCRNELGLVRANEIIYILPEKRKSHAEPN